MFARNLENPRTAEPELDEKSLASRGMKARLLISNPRLQESSLLRNTNPNAGIWECRKIPSLDMSTEALAIAEAYLTSMRVIE